jgi:hypothetical protein
MLLPRATGVILLLYSCFHMVIGMWVPQFPWLLTGCLLVIGSVALLACRPWSRIVVYATALAAAAVGLIGQVDAAGDASTDIPLAVVMWALWTSLWLAVSYLGARFLPDPEITPGAFWPLRLGRADGAPPRG